MLMRNPPHPGRIVLQECLEPLSLTVTDAAGALGVSRNALSELINERRGISPVMAVRLSKAFGGSPEMWAGLQLDYEMAQVLKTAEQIDVERIVRRRQAGA
jgi:addiction module HigA family antidote